MNRRRIESSWRRCCGSGHAIRRGWLAVAAWVLLSAPLRAQTALAPETGLTAWSDAIQVLVARVMPAVVQIQAQGYEPLQGREPSLLAQRSSTGSGVILDATGYVLTNAHVVAGARSIQVQLASEHKAPGGRSILKPRGRLLGGQIVGVDRETDLALLRVEARDLPFLEFGDSDEVHPGELVFAFGSPFGLENSVSMGIVSALARQPEPDHPMVYIQTDAPINPGNSGGPLVDTDGRVVGINTWILSRSGGNEGLGFAAPSNIARDVYQQLRDSGRVRRGEIGVGAQTITPVLARGLRLPRDWGVVLADVVPGSPAAEAGLRIGDIVETLDGKPMENGRQFDVNLYRRRAGELAQVAVWRDGSTRDFSVRVVERRDDATRFLELVSPEKNIVPQLGILAVDLDRNIAGLLPNLRRQRGVVVAASTTGSTRQEEIFEPGDVIYELNGVAVPNLTSLRQEVGRLATGSPAVAQVERRGRLHYVAFESD